MMKGEKVEEKMSTHLCVLPGLRSSPDSPFVFFSNKIKDREKSDPLIFSATSRAKSFQVKKEMDGLHCNCLHYSTQRKWRRGRVGKITKRSESVPLSDSFRPNTKQCQTKLEKKTESLNVNFLKRLELWSSFYSRKIQLSTFSDSPIPNSWIHWKFSTAAFIFCISSGKYPGGLH